MNRLIEARTFVISAHNTINEKGLGHQRLICQHIRSARTLLAFSNYTQGTDYVGLDWCGYELAAAISYVVNGQAQEALASLKWVEDVLGIMLDQKDDPRASVERLIKSTNYPWRGI